MLDPELKDKLRLFTDQFAQENRLADRSKWQIAEAVNDMWDEHKTAFPSKMDYYAECSRVANDGLPVAVFGESGQTMRRWCEVQATYAGMKEAEAFLEALSFRHLEIAKKMAAKGLVAVPVLALAEAVRNGWACDDMLAHYDPATAPHPYDVVKASIENLQAHEVWDFIKSADVKERILKHVQAIDSEVKLYLLAEGKAA